MVILRLLNSMLSIEAYSIVMAPLVRKRLTILMHLLVLLVSILYLLPLLVLLLVSLLMIPYYACGALVEKLVRARGYTVD